MDLFSNSSSSPKTRPLFLIWVLPYFLGLNFSASTPTVAPNFGPQTYSRENDRRNLLVIVFFFFLFLLSLDRDTIRASSRLT